MMGLWLFLVFFIPKLFKLVAYATGIGLVCVAYIVTPFVFFYLGVSFGDLFWPGVALVEASFILAVLAALAKGTVRGKYQRDRRVVRASAT